MRLAQVAPIVSNFTQFTSTQSNEANTTALGKMLRRERERERKRTRADKATLAIIWTVTLPIIIITVCQCDGKMQSQWQSAVCVCIYVHACAFMLSVTRAMMALSIAVTKVIKSPCVTSLPGFSDE